MLIKRFRAYDGESYWYSDDDMRFLNNDKYIDVLYQAPFKLKDIEQFIGKNDAKGCMIYENDIIRAILPDGTIGTKLYQVIWSEDDCGFKKVPYGMPYPETNIDSAFMDVVGTINSQKE